MDSNEKSALLSVFETDRKTNWIFSPCRENIIALYGFEIVCRKPLIVELKRFNIFTESIDVVKRINLNKQVAAIFFQKQMMEVDGYYSFPTCLSPDGHAAAFIHSQTRKPFATLWMINTTTGVCKIYAFDGNDYQRFCLNSRYVSRQLICRSNSDWLLRVDYRKRNVMQYYRLELNHKSNQFSMQLLTESTWPWPFYSLEDVLLFDNKMLEFGHRNGRINRVKIFDFALETWTEVLCGNAADIDLKVEFLPWPQYRIFGTSFDNLLAIHHSGKFSLKYDNVANIWYKTGLTSLHVDLNSNVYLNGREEMGLLRESRLISPNKLTAFVVRKDCRDINVVVNVFSPLNLKEISVLKLCKSYSRDNLLKNIVPTLPTWMRRKFFFTA